jgi:hypothetical protein
MITIPFHIYYACNKLKKCVKEYKPDQTTTVTVYFCSVTSKNRVTVVSTAKPTCEEMHGPWKISAAK